MSVGIHKGYISEPVTERKNPFGWKMEYIKVISKYGVLATQAQNDEEKKMKRIGNKRHERSNNAKTEKCVHKINTYGRSNGRNPTTNQPTNKKNGIFCIALCNLIFHS